MEEALKVHKIMTQKGFAPIIILLAFVLVIFIGVAVFNSYPGEYFSIGQKPLSQNKPYEENIPNPGINSGACKSLYDMPGLKEIRIRYPEYPKVMIPVGKESRINLYYKNNPDVLAKTKFFIIHHPSKTQFEILLRDDGEFADMEANDFIFEGFFTFPFAGLYELYATVTQGKACYWTTAFGRIRVIPFYVEDIPSRVFEHKEKVSFPFRVFNTSTKAITLQLEAYYPKDYTLVNEYPKTIELLPGEVKILDLVFIPPDVPCQVESVSITLKAIRILPPEEVGGFAGREFQNEPEESKGEAIIFSEGPCTPEP